MHQTLRLCAVVVASSIILSTCASARTTQEVRFANGIQATIYSPEYILEHLTYEIGGEQLFAVDGVQYHFVTETTDSAVSNSGDGVFHPMSVEMILQSLATIDMPNVGINTRIYVLPYPRREVLDSSARGDIIFLSPGVREVPDYAVHFTVTHEIGHIFQYRYMPDDDVYAWQRYSTIRGISNRAVFHASASHRNRPHEVFAEDFRYLFGGSLSNYSHGIENPNLNLPDRVANLEAFMSNLIAPQAKTLAQLQVVPNPFNPRTQLQIEFVEDPGTLPATVRVFDAHGRVVRHLFQGTMTSKNLKLNWDGRSDRGEQLASGVYFARLEFAGERVNSKMMMIK